MSGVNVKGRSLCVMAFIISEALPVVPAKPVRHILKPGCACGYDQDSEWQWSQSTNRPTSWTCCLHWFTPYAMAVASKHPERAKECCAHQGEDGSS